MPFQNRIRLYCYLTRAQFPSDRSVFRLADGTIKIQSVVVKKQYELETDYLPEWIHQRIVIALSHDTVNIEGERYFGGVAIDGEYEIEWQEFMDFPWAKAKTKVAVTPFDATNANCQSCEEASQLFLSDDVFPEDVSENSEYTVNVFTNDSIGCSPITAEIVYFNPTFISAATISDLGVLTITTNSLVVPFRSVKVVTYRVTCPNGGYDEADVYANMVGTVEIPCLQPASVNQTGTIAEDSATLTWTAPVTPAADGYEWKYTLKTTPATIIETDTTPGLTVTVPTNGDVLEPNQTYLFSVRSICDLGAEVYSEWLNLEFITAAPENICGRYFVEIFDFKHSDHKDVTYLACNGQYSTVRVQAFKKKSICALQNSAGDPVSIIGADKITYFQPC